MQRQKDRIRKVCGGSSPAAPLPLAITLAFSDEVVMVQVTPLITSLLSGVQATPSTRMKVVTAYRMQNGDVEMSLECQ
jgi:hypothetical protein